VEAATKHTSPVRQALSVAFSVLVFCMLAYWIVAMAASMLVPSR
jgi:hypothetical protein